MKKKFALIALIMGAVMACSAGFAACGTTNDNTDDDKDNPGIVQPGDDDKDDENDETQKKVSKITIKTEPSKTEYWVGETFTVEGGVITVTYRDKTTEDIEMTDEKVEVASVNTNNAVASKSVKVTFEGKSATFYIKIKEKGGVITFNSNYEGAPAAQQVQTEKDVIFTEEQAPEQSRQGYVFDKWYADEDCTVPYLFSSPVESNTTLYAGWKQDGATYCEVTYNLNYYGEAVSEYTQLVKSGDAARELSLTLQRSEFSFGGWYADEQCTVAFEAANSVITTNTEVYAKWTKTKTGSSTYTFEAENVSMDGQEGPGLSGAAGGSAMMVTATNEGVSGKVVSYLYKRGIHVDFCLASSEDATATLTVYVCSEFNINLNSGMYKMTLTNSAGENQVLEYAATDLVEGGAVVGITISNVQLKEGSNVISLITDNDDNPTGVAGSGTYKGTAPMIDKITINSEAVVTWDGVKGLPKDNG